jgi:hypothetical protein
MEDSTMCGSQTQGEVLASIIGNHGLSQRELARLLLLANEEDNTAVILQRYEIKVSKWVNDVVLLTPMWIVFLISVMKLSNAEILAILQGAAQLEFTRVSIADP